jgi:hypothetical protein
MVAANNIVNSVAMVLGSLIAVGLSAAESRLSSSCCWGR